jgi:WD40 repeat protein
LSIQDKAVYGLTTDPFHQYRLASYTEDGVIKIWDTRKANDSLLTINADHTSGLRTPLSRIAFAPSKRGLLASLSRDATAVDLWDIQETGPATNLRNPLQRAASPFEMQPSATNGPSTGETDMSSQGFPWATGVADEDISIPLLWRSRRSKFCNNLYTFVLLFY